MDGIQPYAGSPRPLVAAVHASAPSPASVKTASDYLRAIRRRVWLALAVAIPLATAGTLYVLRMQPVYLVTARIEVKPPKVDPAVKQLVTRGDVGQGDATDEKYVPSTMALLTSKSLAEEVVNDRALGLPASALEGDPAAELIAKIKYRPIPLSYLYDVTLEGRDPERITRTLNFLLGKFRIKVQRESMDASVQAAMQASKLRDEVIDQLKNIEEDLTNHIKNSPSLSPGGKSLKDAEYEGLRSRLFYQQQQVSHLQQQGMLETMKPAPVASVDHDKAQRIADLIHSKKNFAKRLASAERISRDPSDPAIMMARKELDEIEADLAQLQDDGASRAGVSPSEVFDQILAQAAGEIQNTEREISSVMAEMRGSMPVYQKYTTLMSEREQKTRQLAELKEKLAAYNIYTSAQKEPVKVWDPATPPTSPKSPNRTAYIGICIVFSLGLGLALVCLMEHIDHSVKVPEHLTMGLGLPLFGVVPRMLRNARNHRGGHLWTPGTPDSIEADAYRNLRASLLGSNPGKKPIVTLLVTSAKAGEGKSTTALNLAATCARAGERTLLMDVDLRRPSLNDVFPGNEDGTGLVDVLRGDLPWQRTVVQTDLPNLDFLPTGETREVPIEVLGSLELRQLLISLSEHHYDRVVLDGPAVLGLADCRMLGRIVDAALMVVRSGSQELRPLQRAKSMLEQSQVCIAGVVFNGLIEDLQNWSSYGPNPLLDPSLDLAGGPPAGISRGLDSRRSGAAALAAAGTVEA